MFTSVDKALAAIVMAALFLLNEFAGIRIGLNEQTLGAVLSAATPILVYLIPNRGKTR